MGLSSKARSDAGPSVPGTTDEHSVTDLGEPALIRATALEIARGSVLAGRYQIEAVLGKGGSGIVLRAFDRVAQAAVAVKILKPELAADQRWVERFWRELRLARQIQHAHVCRVFDIGQADGHWFITMELASGGTLRDQLSAKTVERTTTEKLSDVHAVVAGLAAIHDAGIVHRDVKPDNFLRMADGRLVLSDFGLATNPADAPTVSIMVGTPHYMAPEVAMGDVASKRSDVWSAGVVIHEILLGERPERKFVTLSPFVKAPRGALRTTTALLDVCRVALSEDPSKRPLDGRALVGLVASASSGHGARLRRLSARGKSAAWGITVLATIALAAVFGRRLWQPVAASSTVAGARVKDIRFTGEASDWNPGSKVFATFEQRVHCFSVLPGHERVRVVWGSPRRAAEIDVASGRREPSTLPAETYATDCPQLSPKGDSLLFTGLSGLASPQIMRSDPTGRNAIAVTTGSDPRWLPNGEEFVYDVDPGHAGVFSLPTMASTIFSDDRRQSERYLYRKAVSEDGSTVAISYIGDSVDRLLEVHSLPDMRLVASWQMPPSIRSVGFSLEGLVLTNVTGRGTIDLLNWRTGEARHSGYLPNQNVESVFSLAGESRILLSSIKSFDVWLSGDGPTGRQLTHDGRNYGASWSPRGDVLVAKETSDNRLVIFRYEHDGTSRQVTEGPYDAMPSFSQDGEAWTYADYQRNAIVFCDSGGCRNVRREKLPARPTISPDHKHIAFVDQVGTNYLSVINVDGSNRRDLVPVNIECPPVWLGATSLWAYAGSGSNRSWQELDLETGKRTGRSKAAATANPDEPDCGAKGEPVDSPFFQHVRIAPRERWEARSREGLTAGN
jgi:serine/threonine protein kinase